MGIRFTWDIAKARSNRGKHGVSFEEALTVFRDPLALIFDDPGHSVEESRELIVGHSAQNRLLIVVFTERNDTIRIISARTATGRERAKYAQTKR